MVQITDDELEVLQQNLRKRRDICTVVVVITFILALAFFGYETWITQKMDLSQKIDLLECVLEYLIYPVGEAVILTFGALYVLDKLFLEKPYNQFNRAYKDRFVLSTIQRAGHYEDLSYDKSKGFSYEDIQDSAVVGCGCIMPL